MAMTGRRQFHRGENRASAGHLPRRGRTIRSNGFGATREPRDYCRVENGGEVARGRMTGNGRDVGDRRQCIVTVTRRMGFGGSLESVKLSIRMPCGDDVQG